MTDKKLREVFERYKKVLGQITVTGEKVVPRELDKRSYDTLAIPAHDMACHLAWMVDRCLACLVKNEPGKARVWLGYVQGELRGLMLYTITDLRNHNRADKPAEPVTYGTVPRRFRIPVEKHPTSETAKWFYGCYFPQTDLIVGEGGVRGTGIPTPESNPGLEWLDEPSNG
jgi:hypothetical protein